MTDDVSDREEFAKAIEDILSEGMENYSVIVASNYSDFVEYGSTPVKDRESKMPKVEDENLKGQKEMVTEARKNIRDWVAKKKGLTGKDRIIQGDKMYKHIMDHGTAPHPFIRPAINDAKNMKAADILQLYDNSENFMEAYAEFIAERMRYYLNKNGSVVSGALISSIYVIKSDDVPPNTSQFDPDKGDAK